MGVVTVGTAGGPSQQSSYPAKISFPGTPLPGCDLPRAVGVNLAGQIAAGVPLLALIGRDFLASAVLVYNGPSGMFSLSL